MHTNRSQSRTSATSPERASTQMKRSRQLRMIAYVAAIALTLGVGVSPAFADSPAPMQHFSMPAEGQIVCGSNTYTFTSGYFNALARDPSVAAHMTLDHVTAVDQSGKTVRVVGAETYNDALNRLTAKVMFISQDGGKVDSVNIVWRAWSNGHFVGFDFGTCGF
jgi:hypothetical protein